MDIAEFIGARLNEDETRATTLQQIAREAIERLKEPRFLGREIPGWFTWPDVDAMCTRTLRDIEAKQAIVARHHPDEYGLCDGCPRDSGGEPDYEADECMEKRDIAAIWDGHRDYLESWKP